MGNQHETQYEYEGGQEEDDSLAPIFSERVLELMARAIAEYFTGTQILSILKSEGFEDVEYPKTKWKILYDLFLDIKRGRLVPKHTKGFRAPYEENKIISIVQEFLYPLNHGADEEKAQKLADEIEKLVKYDGLIMLHMKGKYFITDEEGKEILLDEVMDEQRHNFNEEMEEEWANAKRKEELKKKDLQNILSQKALIEEIHSLHQAYIDLLEVFCDNPTKPSEEMNGFYVYLRGTLQSKVQSLGLKHFKLNLYTPFKRDLYSAEKEWKDDVLKGEITWDKVRPSLNHFHGEIGQFYRYSKKDEEKSTGEKKLEDINNLVSKHKAKKSEVVQTPVEKLEVLHKYEKETERPKIKLSDCDVSFDDEIAQLMVGDFCIVEFPPHKNEHYLLRKLFSQRKSEPIDWQDVYDAMTRTKSETVDKGEIERQKKSVKDAVRSLNNRVKEVCNTDSELLHWETKTIKRNY